jgi:hypothetical protein
MYRWDGDRVPPNLMGGDRYSKPTKHIHTDTDKILAICDDGFPSARAIVDSTKLALLPD